MAKVYVNGGILIKTRYFACKGLTCLADNIPEEARIINPNTKCEGSPCLIIDDKHPQSLFNDYYAKTFVSSLYEGAEFLRMTSEDCFNEFYASLNEIEEIVNSLEINSKHYKSIIKLLYINVVTCLDSLVRSIILCNISRDEELFLKYYDTMISKSDKAVISKHLINDDRGKWEKEILEKIDGVSYCNVDIIKKSFESMGLDKPIDNNGIIGKHFENRHILVHQNGKMGMKNTRMEVLEVDKIMVEKEIVDITEYAEQLRVIIAKKTNVISEK